MGITDKEKKILASAKKKLATEFKVVKTKLQKAEKDVEKYMCKNPGKSAAIAAGIGAAIGAGIVAAVMKHKKK